MGRNSNPVLFIDPADNRLTTLGEQRGQRGRGGGGEEGDGAETKGKVQQKFTCGKETERSRRKEACFRVKVGG